MDHHTLKFWKQVRGMGSKLLVGLPSSQDDSKSSSSSSTCTDMVLNACASESVDAVVYNAPAELSVEFLDGIGVDYVVCLAAAETAVGEDVVACGRCLVLNEEGVVSPKVAKTKEM